MSSLKGDFYLSNFTSENILLHSFYPRRYFTIIFSSLHEPNEYYSVLRIRAFLNFLFFNIFSSGISSGSLASIGGTTQRPSLPTSTDTNSSNVTIKNGGTDIFDNNHLPNGNVDKSNSLFDVSDFLWSSDSDHQHNNVNNVSNQGHNSYHEDLNSTAGILQDPFDAEWAALAMRNTVSKNPFVNSDKIRDSETGLKKAFELQM